MIIYYSGHGILDNTNTYYLYIYDVDINNLDSDCLKYDQLEQLLENIPARKKLLIVNAGNSGEYDDDPLKFRLMKWAFSDLRFGTGAVGLPKTWPVKIYRI